MIVNVQVALSRIYIGNLPLSLKPLDYRYHSPDVFICYSG
jgi:hypothetical protein